MSLVLVAAVRSISSAMERRGSNNAVFTPVSLIASFKAFGIEAVQSWSVTCYDIKTVSPFTINNHENSFYHCYTVVDKILLYYLYFLLLLRAKL